MERYVKVGYLGTHLNTLTLLLDMFCCSLKNAKKSFYHAFNSIFGKVGRITYENVVIKLLNESVLWSGSLPNK